MRLLAEGADAAGIAAARELLHAVDARLSRFRRGLRAGAAERRSAPTVPASALLRAAVAAAVWAAERTAGSSTRRCSATLEREGYTRSLAGARRAARAARRRGRRGTAARPAAAPRPRPGAPWRSTTRRAPSPARPACGSTRGGTTKGLAADAAARCCSRRRPAPPLVVDCGGDLRVAVAPGAAPFDVVVEHPLTASPPRRWRSAAAGSRRPGWRGACGAAPAARPPSPARPGDRRARLDRADLRHRPRRDRARRRGARQGRAAARARRRAPAPRPPRRRARPRRRDASSASAGRGRPTGVRLRASDLRVAA